tara:strand:+ start:477 stop:725 length:249 start_codon:yes stop_codon:yes gene_type:complete
MIIGEMVFYSIDDTDWSDAAHDIFSDYISDSRVIHFELIAPGNLMEIEFGRSVSNNEAYLMMDDLAAELRSIGVRVDDWYTI